MARPEPCEYRPLPGRDRRYLSRRILGLPLATLVMAILLPSQSAAQERVDELLPLTPDGRIQISAVVHDIRISTWDRSEVSLTGTIDPATERLEIDEGASQISIRVVHDESGSSEGARSLELTIPRSARLSVASVSGSLELEGTEGPVSGSAVSGSIRMDGSGPSAALGTVSGHLDVTGSIAEVEFRTVSGDIRFAGTADRVALHSVSGNVTVEGTGSTSRLRANSVAGDIVFDGALSPSGSLHVESHSGNVALTLPAGTSARFEASSFSGTIRNGLTADAPGSGPLSRSLRFRTGTGDAEVRIDTFSGSIVLEPSG